MLPVLLLTLLLLSLWVALAKLDDRPAPTKSAHRGPRPLRSRTPDDCPQCRDVMAAPSLANVRSVVPYAQRKSRRGRRRTIDTRGQACPNPDCDYYRITDSAVHALVGYGHQGRHDPIQDLYCQACRHKFESISDRRQFVQITSRGLARPVQTLPPWATARR